jgi:hypothetical protein
MRRQHSPKYPHRPATSIPASLRRVSWRHGVARRPGLCSLDLRGRLGVMIFAASRCKQPPRGGMSKTLVAHAAWLLDPQANWERRDSANPLTPTKAANSYARKCGLIVPRRGLAGTRAELRRSASARHLLQESERNSPRSLRHTSSTASSTRSPDQVSGSRTWNAARNPDLIRFAGSNPAQEPLHSADIHKRPAVQPSR